MPIHIEERDAGQILYVAFTDTWDTEDLKQAIAAIQNRLSYANHPIHLVIDARSTFQVPLGTLSHMPVKRSSLGTALITECIVIGGTNISRGIAQAAFRLCHLNRFAFVDTEEQAFSHLRSAARLSV